jgi:hypothetical protein
MLACFCYDAIRLTHATHEAIMVYAGHGDSANMWQQNIVVFLLLLLLIRYYAAANICSIKLNKIQSYDC